MKRIIYKRKFECGMWKLPKNLTLDFSSWSKIKTAPLRKSDISIAIDLELNLNKAFRQRNKEKNIKNRVDVSLLYANLLTFLRKPIQISKATWKLSDRRAPITDFLNVILLEEMRVKLSYSQLFDLPKNCNNHFVCLIIS